MFPLPFPFKTYKICANHLIGSNIELQPMNGNDKVWIWAAQVCVRAHILPL